MSSHLDPSEFVDDDFQNARKTAPVAAPQAAGGPSGDASRAPSREEVEARATEMQNKLTELKQVQQELERERAALEELRRRQAEFTTGRQEMVQNLTRGVGLLEEAEFAARRDAEQMAKSLAEFRNALVKMQSISEETWTKDNLHVELTRALTIVENARMEWNAARLKFPVLSGTAAAETPQTPAGRSPFRPMVEQKSFVELCKLGLALTWPLVLAGVAIFVVILLRW